MECWAENKWKSCNNSQDEKSNGCDKQTDDFLETFPNFMTLTDEERHEFFQTLYAAKIKLEKSGVTVKSHFGTIHDQSWNDSYVLENDKEKSADNDISTSSVVETGVHQPSTPTQYKNKISVGRFSSMGLRNSVIQENLERNFKEENTCPEVSQENSPACLETSNSLKNLNLEEEIQAFSEVHKMNSLKSLNNTFIIPSLSYEPLKHHDSTLKKPGHHQENVNLLRIKGTKLKFQVTLTSGDNERMRKTLPEAKAASGDDENSSGKTLNVFCVEEDKRLESEDKKSAEERINDPEPKDLLNVEEESKEADLPEEKKKPQPKILPKRSFVKDKSKENRGELKSKKTVLGKPQGRKKEISRNAPQDKLLHEEECQLGRTILEKEKDRMLQRSDTKVIIGDEYTKTNVSEGSDNTAGTSTFNSLKWKEGSSEPKETMIGTQQRILVVTTVKEGMGSKASLEKQETEVAGKKENKMKSERQMRVEKLKKYVEKKEGLYQQKLKKKSQLKGKEKEKSPDLRRKKSNEEEVISEKNSKVVSVNSFIKDTEKEEKEESSSTSEEKTTAGGGSSEEMEEVQKENLKTEAGKISDSDLTEVPEPTPRNVSLEEEEKVAEVSESAKEILENSIPLPFKQGKMVFIDDNVIEKMRNVILDLEKKTKAYDYVTENEYLILIVEYVEYLSTVMASLLEDQITGNANVKLNEENLTENQQRESAPTTEDDLQSEKELETRKRRKKNKPWKVSFLRRLRKFFYFCKKKKRRKAANANLVPQILKLKN